MQHSNLLKVLEPQEMHKLGAASPHTSHCAPNGEIMISIMGTPNGDSQGDFLCIDSNTLEIKEMWTEGDEKAKFGYDFWYQPYHDVLIASEWATPRIFKRGYQSSDSKNPCTYSSSFDIQKLAKNPRTNNIRKN